MFCHIVSKTYLEKWKIKDKKDSIYVFYKNDLTKLGECRDLNNLTKTEFGYTNYYYLKIEDCNHKIFDDLFQDVLLEIKKQYILKLNKLEITTAAQFRIAYLNKKDKLKLYRRDNNAEIKLSRINCIILEKWDSSKKLYIENFFSREIENFWTKIVEEFQKICKTKEKLSNENRERLILFIATQISRNHKKHNEMIKISTKDDDVKNILVISIYEFIKLYRNEITNYGDNYIYEIYKQLKNSKLNITILLTQLSFITTDNPIIMYKYHLKDSILVPITPKMCLIIQNSLIDGISVKSINNDKTKEINNILIKNSINNIVYFDNTILDIL